MCPITIKSCICPFSPMHLQHVCVMVMLLTVCTIRHSPQQFVWTVLTTLLVVCANNAPLALTRTQDCS